LTALGIDVTRDKPWLFGHSDGGSISLLYASRFTDALAGAIVLAPHIMVEDLSVSSIERAREGLPHDRPARRRLARHHDDPDSAFWGWNGIWLHPPFPRLVDRGRDRRRFVARLLAMQGVDDEYGTLEQIRGIASAGTAHAVGRNPGVPALAARRTSPTG
jgi:pimeloyl-ACP methyl ester carboxylesterase